MNESTRASLPEPDPVSPVPESVSVEEEEDVPDFSHLPDKHRDAMRQLHRRVEEAAETIERLRAENEQLRAENEQLRHRIDELEAQPAFPEAETVLALDDDPEEVKARITQFIDAIDTYLDASEPPSGPAELPDDDSTESREEA